MGIDRQDTIQELRATGWNLSKTARSLGLDYVKLKEEFGVHTTPLPRPTEPMPSDIRTLGKPGMRSWVIAVKVAGGEWPLSFFNEIQQGRTKYDEGTHEMCQQNRPDGWVVLYLIPRTVRRVRRPYFRAPLGEQ